MDNLTGRISALTRERAIEKCRRYWTPDPNPWEEVA